MSISGSSKKDKQVGQGKSKRAGYEGVVVAAPVSVPYERFSPEPAHWWLAKALAGLGKRAGLSADDIDGLCVSSFTLFPDTAVGITQHFGLTPRWLDHVPTGGASGVVTLRRAARAVQAGDANIVACIAGDTNHVDSFRAMLTTFSRFSQDASYPYGSGGPNGSFSLITSHHMKTCGTRREDFGKICVAQRANALNYPGALMQSPLTLEQYMDSRLIADPIVRTRGTLVGSVCHADPQGDWASVMSSLGGSIVAQGPNGRRSILVADFVTGPFQNVLRPDELAIEAVVPAPVGTRAGSYLKLERRVGDFATVGVAVSLEFSGNEVARAGIGLTGVGASTINAGEAAQELVGEDLNAGTIERASDLAAQASRPRTDHRGSEAYKRHIVATFVTRILSNLQLTIQEVA